MSASEQVADQSAANLSPSNHQAGFDTASRPKSQLMREVRYTSSSEFVGILHHLNATLLISTYQAGKVAVVGTQGSELRVSIHNFEQAMGLAYQAPWLAVGSRREVWLLRQEERLAAAQENGRHVPPQFVARKAHVTGNVHIHEMAWVGAELWYVNTLFSCLCTLDDKYSFVPCWRPPFITELAAEDRCHLNGLAVQDGRPRYVTAMAESNVARGWRAEKNTTGCVIDIETGETVVHGLTMPHSPRAAGDQLWVLNSGHGQLSTIDPQHGHCEAVEQLPGYTRGLDFAGQFAFVGLSKIRETSVFGGMPISERQDELRCGVAVVDLVSGRAVAAFQFLSGVDEVFDVRVLPGSTSAQVVGPHCREDGQDEAWIIPSQ